MKRSNLKEMIKKVVLDEKTTKDLITELKSYKGKDMRSVYYELGDKVYGLVELGKNIDDSVIKQQAKKMTTILEGLKKYFNAKYKDWD